MSQAAAEYMPPSPKMNAKKPCGARSRREEWVDPWVELGSQAGTSKCVENMWRFSMIFLARNMKNTYE